MSPVESSELLLNSSPLLPYLVLLFLVQVIDKEPLVGLISSLLYLQISVYHFRSGYNLLPEVVPSVRAKLPPDDQPSSSFISMNVLLFIRSWRSGGLVGCLLVQELL